MRKPTKPKAPVKPKKPEEFTFEECRVYLNEAAEEDDYEEDYDSDKVFPLNKAIEKAYKYINKQKNNTFFYPYDGGKTKYEFVERKLTISDLSFGMHAGSYEWEPMLLFSNKFRNKKYKTELAKYKKDLTGYEKKKKTYDAACKKYTADQREYLKYEAGVKKQEKISKLKKELKELQS